MAVCFLGIGSNLGDRRDNIQSALARLGQEVEILACSRLIETDPVGGPPQGPFLNAAAKIQTDRSPEELLELCQSIERQLGRIRTVADGPRVIDLDILLYDDLAVCSERLTIPHPRMYKRLFVLIPLNEIAPELKLKHLIDKLS